jgi:hypothetical protein
MSTTRRLLACALIAAAALISAGCDEGGIGMGVPSSGARWGGGGGSGPGVLVAGGPVYR